MKSNIICSRFEFLLIASYKKLDVRLTDITITVGTAHLYSVLVFTEAKINKFSENRRKKFLLPIRTIYFYMWKKQSVNCLSPNKYLFFYTNRNPGQPTTEQIYFYLTIDALYEKKSWIDWWSTWKQYDFNEMIIQFASFPVRCLLPGVCWMKWSWKWYGGTLSL